MPSSPRKCRAGLEEMESAFVRDEDDGGAAAAMALALTGKTHSGDWQADHHHHHHHHHHPNDPEDEEEEEEHHQQEQEQQHEKKQHSDDPLSRFVVLPALDGGELDDLSSKACEQDGEPPDPEPEPDPLAFQKQTPPGSSAGGFSIHEGGERVYRKGIWMLPELLALQSARKAGMGKFGYRTRNNKSEKERWQDIENVLWLQGIQRSADQCRSRWEYISREFRKISEYESGIQQQQQQASYWHLSQPERKDKDLPINFYPDLFQAMSEWMGVGKNSSSSSSALLAIGEPVVDAVKCLEPLASKAPPTFFGDGPPGKRRKVSGRPSGAGAGAGVLHEQNNNRSIWTREVQLQAEEGCLLLCNCSIINLGSSPSVSKGEHVLIKNKHIAYVGASPACYPSQIVDMGGRYLLPGLCDAHVHVTAVTANLHDMVQLPPSLIAARATKILHSMLLRGFTTVRDAGGCDWGLAKAVEEGTILGPRLLFSGRALSQTGGHGDMRLPGEDHSCSCSANPLALGRVCDGVAQVRKAARDELRKGASQIKIMASGGVSSPTDHLNNLQFSAEEISAIVEEAAHCGKYVCAHAYTASAVKRAVELGVRSIEHGNLIDGESLELMKRKGAFLVPTLVTYNQIRRSGEASGMPGELVAKVGNLLERGLEVLSLAEQKGVNICFGTDLLGSMHEHQLEEFGLRARVQSSISILRSATSSCAQLFNMEGKIGCVSQGAFADLLVLDKNPVADISVLEDPGNLIMIFKQGEAVKLPKSMSAKVLDGRTWSHIC